MSTDAYVEHVRELLASVPNVRFRRMFGGVGVYSGPGMFALIADDQLYLKTDAETRPVFEGAGSAAFQFQTRDGRTAVTSYCSLPAGAEESPEEAERWARLGLAAAERAAVPKAKRRASAPVQDLGPGPWDG